MKKRFSIESNVLQCVIKLAHILMKKFEGDPDFGDVKIQTVYPLLSPEGEKNIFFEVKFSSPTEPDHGYAILSLCKKYLPVLKFAFHGPSQVELLQLRVGNWNFNPVFYSPFFIVAEDDKGRYLTALGDPPVYIGKRKKATEKKEDKSFPKSKKSMYTVFKEQFLKQMSSVSDERKELLKKAWKRVTIKRMPMVLADESILVDPEELPTHSYQTVTAKNYRSIPRYHQLLPGEGLNQNDFASGCMSNAWMNLIGYFDNTSTPDILRGTYKFNTPDYLGCPDRIMMVLSEYLGTEACVGTEEPSGCASYEEGRKGFDFIKNYLKKDFDNKKDVYGQGIPILQAIYDFLCFHQVPSVAGVSVNENLGHALIAYEVKLNLDDLSEDHYVRVYTGNREEPSFNPFPNDPYISYEDLTLAFAVDKIKTGTEVKLQWKSLNIPTPVDVGNALLIAFRRDDENICLAVSHDGRNFQLKRILNSTGTGAPSLAISPGGKYVYLAWSDSTNIGVRNPLRLVKISPPNYEVTELPAPHAPEGDKGVSPAITIARGKLYYLWGSKTYFGLVNLACTPLDELERSGVPWPASPFASYTPEGSFWKTFPIRMTGQPSLVEWDIPGLGPHLIFAYMAEVQTTSSFGLEMQLEWINYDGLRFNQQTIPWSGERNASVCFFNGTLYACTHDEIYTFDGWLQYNPRPKLWPVIESLNGPILGSFNAISIGPCLFSAWVGYDGYLYLRYHSEDRAGWRLDCSNWPLETQAWPDF